MSLRSGTQEARRVVPTEHKKTQQSRHFLAAVNVFPRGTYDSEPIIANRVFAGRTDLGAKKIAFAVKMEAIPLWLMFL